MPTLPAPASATLYATWRWAMLLGLPCMVAAMVIAQVLSPQTIWTPINLWLYGGLSAGLALCWLPLLWPRSAHLTPALVGAAVGLGGAFFVLKLGLLVWLATPQEMVSQLAQSFFWFPPLLMLALLARELPLVRRLSPWLLGVVSLMSAFYFVTHLNDPAARVALTALTELNLASWITLWVAGLYLPQRELQTLQSGERAALEQLAYTDLLTGLPNRLHLERELERHMTPLGPNQNQTPLTLLFVDLDSFKVANDTLGHAEGDRILQAVAGVLRGVSPLRALVCRLSGDEFVVVLPGEPGHVGEALGEAIQLQLARSARDQAFHITVSIGVSVYPDDARTPADLLRHADSAMYAVKLGGKQDVRRYRHADGATERAQILARDVVGGLRRNEFSLVYQPLFDLVSGQMIKVEALMRWEHPELGSVSPESFIAVAEQVGSIVVLGNFALREACHAALAWPELRVCVNVSALQALQHNFVPQVEQILKESGLSADRLELELTETLLMHGDAGLAAVLRSLRRVGVTLCMDDFGTGYSNLSRLRTLPIQGLKIDRSFTAALIGPAAERAYPLALMQAVVEIGKVREIEVTVEGIEAEQQLEWVRALGRVTVQGRLFGGPVSAGALEIRHYSANLGRPDGAVSPPSLPLPSAEPT